MEDVRLSSPKLDVTMDDGRVLTTQVLNPDYLRWDRTSAKHGWGKADAAPFTWLTFVAWSALRREQQIDDSMTWEAFSERHCIQVRNVAGADADELLGASNGVGPTLQEVAPG